MSHLPLPYQLYNDDRERDGTRYRNRGEKELTIEKFFGKTSRFLSGIDSLISNNMYISTCVRHQHVVDIDQVDMFDLSVWRKKSDHQRMSNIDVVVSARTIPNVEERKKSRFG